MRIKTHNIEESKKILSSIEIAPYEKYVDLVIESPKYKISITNKRDNDYQFIPHQFRFHVFYLSEDKTEEWLDKYKNVILI